MLNWIVLNRTDYLNKNGFGVKETTKGDMPLNPTNQPINIKVLKRTVFDLETVYLR